MQTLAEMIHSLGYKQHFSFHINLTGHILHAVIINFESDLTFRCLRGKFVSDHRGIVVLFVFVDFFEISQKEPNESSQISEKME